jgi:hypothetical protein
MTDSSPVGSSQADQAVPALDVRASARHWKAIGLLVATNAIAGAYFNPMGANENQVCEIAAYAAIGFLITQPVLFAFWAAFAPHRFYQRFLWAFLTCSSVAFIEELGAVRHNQSGLGETMALQLAFFILFTAILLLVRRYVGWRFEGSQPAAFAGDYQAYQFGIKHLILLTIITGVICAMIRSLMLLKSDVHGRMQSVAEFIACACVCFALATPIIVVPWFTMCFRGNMVKLIAFAIVFSMILDLASALVLQEIAPASSTGTFADEIGPILLMQLGGVLSVGLNTIVLRLCGYRLIRERKTASS